MPIGKERMKQIQQELESLRKHNRGVLRPADVVAAARKKESAMHSYFEWNKSKAAEQYLLWQARELIQMVVIVEKHTNKTIRPFVSLVEDRKLPGGGYRHIEDVMNDPEMRASLIGRALFELESVRARYESLTELASVWREIDRVRARASKPVSSRKSLPIAAAAMG